EGLASCAHGGDPPQLAQAGWWMFEVQPPTKEDDVRVTTAYNRMLELPGAWVRDVGFGEQAMIVTVALRRKKPICAGCGATGLTKDQGSSRQALAASGCWRGALHARLRRSHGVAGAADEPGVKGRRWLASLELPLEERESVNAAM